MTDAIPVTINIMDKEYVVSCPVGEEESLRESARVLGERMNSARDGGKTLGTERIAVVTALNFVHEYLTAERQRAAEAEAVDAGITMLAERIDAAIGRRSGPERVD